MKIAVVSGKGGSGKSSVSAAFVDLSHRVVAVDCDVDASNLPLLFESQVQSHERFASGEAITVNPHLCVGCGICVSKCAFHALVLSMKGYVQPKDYLCEGCGLCVRLCPHHALKLVPEENSDIFTGSLSQGILVHGRLNPGDDNSGKMIAKMRDIADSVMEQQQIPLQILDGPPGIGCPVLSTVTGMDRVVLVTEPTLSGFSDLQRVYKIASSFCKTVSVIINKCDLNTENRTSILDFCQQNHLPVIAELPFDRIMVEAQLHSQSIVAFAPESVCAKVLKDAYAKLVG